MRKTLHFYWIVALLFCAAHTVQSATVTLLWDANPEPNIAGYKLHYGTASGTYTQVIDVGNSTTATVSNLPAGPYFFAATAYNTAGVESLPSNEVASGPTPTPSPTPISQITVSPSSVTFAAVAGGAAPATQSIRVTTSNGAPWNSFDTSPWFNAGPTGGTSGTSTTLVPNIQSLVAGTYSQNIIFSAAGLPDRTVVMTLTLTASSTPTPTPGPTPTSVNISGNLSYCSNPAPGPVPDVTLTLTGTASGSTLSDGSGNYQLSTLAAGGSYIVTPAKSAMAPGSTGVDTIDVVATQRHFLNVAALPPGCLPAAADVNGDSVVNTVDVVATQRFFLGLPTGTANTGKYSFSPASRTYLGLTGNQTGQNYDTLVFGDVALPFADRMDSPPESATTIREVALPQVALDQFVINFMAEVTATTINARDKLVGFQGDFTFDSTVVTFDDPPVSNAGLTARNWNVSGNVLAGTGPIRTLRISAFSNDFTPLSGSGVLFNLNMIRGTNTAGSNTVLTWAAAPDQLIFIDADLTTQKPRDAASGSVSLEPTP